MRDGGWLKHIYSHEKLLKFPIQIFNIRLYVCCPNDVEMLVALDDWLVQPNIYL